MIQKSFSNVVGIDDAPFERNHCGRVKIVGTVYADLRLDGVLIGDIQKDGDDAADAVAALVGQSKFAEHIQLVMLQGITLGGFNVVDVYRLHRMLSLPIVVVARKRPDMAAFKKALTTHIRGGDLKWAMVEKLGPMEPAGAVYVQRVGLSLEQAASVTRHFAVHSHIPEPLRAAHLIAGSLACGQSRGNP